MRNDTVGWFICLPIPPPRQQIPTWTRSIPFDLKWVRPTVGALLDSSSVRQSARLLDIHHSTMQSRVEILTDALGFDPLDGVGRARLGMAFLTWRMRHSRALELPPPNN